MVFANIPPTLSLVLTSDMAMRVDPIYEQITRRWLDHPEEREALVGQLRELRDRVAVPGAVERAAEFLIAELSSVSQTPVVP